MIEAILRKGYTGDAERRACKDCRHCKAAVTWWCTNPVAIAARKSREIGIRDCEFWESCRNVNQLSFSERFDLALGEERVMLIENVGEKKVTK